MDPGARLSASSRTCSSEDIACPVPRAPRCPLGPLVPQGEGDSGASTALLYSLLKSASLRACVPVVLSTLHPAVSPWGSLSLSLGVSLSLGSLSLPLGSLSPWGLSLSLGSLSLPGGLSHSLGVSLPGVSLSLGVSLSPCGLSPWGLSPWGLSP